MNSSQTIGRSHSRKHYHQHSMDDFMKNIKKYNLRSQRYISPKPLFYMYAKNNTTNTIEKSRSKTHSNHKSPNSKSKRQKKQKEKKSNSKTMKTKLQKIFNGGAELKLKDQAPNPAFFIQQCGDKIKKAQKYLQGKSSVGLYLCQQFLIILNELVQKMVNQLDKQLKQIQTKAQKQIQQKYVARVDKLERKTQKMNKIIQQLYYKAENNSKLIYEIRKFGQIDVDYIFGKTILKTDKCGGYGYRNNSVSGYSNPQQQQILSYLPQQTNQPIFTKNQYDGNNKNQRLRMKAEESMNQLKQQLRRHHNEFINPNFDEQDEAKESGRIRQAYDWERQAHDDRQKFIFHQKKFILHHKEIIGNQQNDEQEQNKMGNLIMHRNSN